MPPDKTINLDVLERLKNNWTGNLEKFSDFYSIFECIAGSRLYGTSTENSDTDIRGVFIPSSDYFLSSQKRIEQIESKSQDVVLFEIRKFFNLCLECNPNIVELLFVPESCQILSTSIWEEITKNHSFFLSKKARYTFSGYAMSQLHRIKQHRNWLLNPKTKRPERKDFGIPNDKTLVTKDQLNAYDELKENYNLKDELNPNFLHILQLEKAFLNANKEYNQYQEWLKNRNPKRAKIEATIGYDTKHASHLYRLISEGEEFLLEGHITFPRPDAKLLLEIINGKFSYEELMEMVGNLDEKFDEIVKKSTLPNIPDSNRADQLCMKIVREAVFN